ncbi:MAG: hypothetical protein QNK23_00895 [Crocinitomicaceae bacterium]|nr:hypothetical protein [Crocinitomicaceae bacterium]
MINTLKERLKKKTKQHQKADCRDWRKRKYKLQMEKIQLEIKVEEKKAEIARLKKQNGQ